VAEPGGSESLPSISVLGFDVQPREAPQDEIRKPSRLNPLKCNCERAPLRAFKKPPAGERGVLPTPNIQTYPHNRCILA
jgi:hypothetical protein